VLAEPAPIVGVATLADKSISIAVKPWVKVPDYLPAGAEINRAIVDRLAAAGVDYPGAAREIRLVGALPPCS
jgi:small conductance mechanosensitive channel